MHTVSVKKSAKIFAVLLVIACSLAAGYFFISPLGTMGDESLHEDQIHKFEAGHFVMNPSITQIPGYHSIVALIAFLYKADSLASLRLISLVLGILSVLAFLGVAWKLDAKSALGKTLQYVFLPILFPFFFLLYTDVTSNLFVLFAFYYALKRNYTLAGVLGILSVYIRQNNIAWLGFLLVLYTVEEFQTVRALSHLSLTHLRRTFFGFLKWLKHAWMYLLGFALFAAFVYLNKGIAIGDKNAHPEFSFHLGNIYFLLFVSFLLLLPLHVANARKIAALLTKRKLLIVGCILFFVFFLFTFQNTHPYNQWQYEYFLRNRFLIAFTQSIYLKTVFFLAVLVTVLSLSVTKLLRPSFYLLYPFSFLYLVPSWLIEQRYYFIPFLLFILMRKAQSTKVEYAQTIFSILLSAGLFYGIIQGKFFL